MLSEGTEGLKNMMEQAEQFAVVMDKDAAEAAARLTDQMTQLKGGFAKIQASIAENLIPILIPLIDKIRDAISNVSVWMKANPGLTKTIIVIVAAVGGLLTVLGPILIMLPGIIALLPILGAAFAVLTGPIGLIIAAIVGLVAVTVLIIKNWEKVKLFFIGVWVTIRNTFYDNVNFIISLINNLIKAVNKIPFINIGEIGYLGQDKTGVKKYAKGGMITEPTMLSSIRTGLPYGIAGEAGPEPIGRGGGGSVITNNFDIAQLVVRENADVERIARELFVMQQQRVRGAGA